VCNECPSNKINGVGINYCGECGCVIKAKVFSKENACPLNKWNR
jgi:transcription initiation factor TFIIIB Brf1 subunit/transcription initiation factor TFIIB